MAKIKKIAFYGGSFDPPHNGHLTIARKLTELFALDEFVFIPAFHAPHKKDRKPTSAFHRFAMLALATENESKIKISLIELDAPEKPFTFETQTKLKKALPAAKIFFVIGADSWAEINAWREWEKVLRLTNVIVVTRPDYKISFLHVSEEIRTHVTDLRKNFNALKTRRHKDTKKDEKQPETWNLELGTEKIYITDAVNLDISATEIRRKIRAQENDWQELVPTEVANYIEKYELYI